MSSICCSSRYGFSRLFTINGSCSGQLIQRTIPCVTNDGGQRGARWTKPWRPGDIKLWNKGIYDYSYKRGRTEKVAKVNFPKFDETRQRQKEYSASPDEMRSYQKEQGVVPPRSWNERPLTMTHTNSIFDPYVPKQGDEIPGWLSAETFTDKFKKNSSWLALRKIRSYIDDFDPKFFAMGEAFDTYIKVHEIICKLSSCEDNCDLELENDIFDLVTEKAYTEILHNTERKTIRWKYIKNLEEPYCVRVRYERGMDGGDLWAQVTVRFHSQQILAIYDRFGRLMSGSENIVKDVLEYVVYEIHLTDDYGRWRIHGKIIPDWIINSATYSTNLNYATYRKPAESKEEPEPNDDGKEGKKPKKVLRKFVTGRRMVEEIE